MDLGPRVGGTRLAAAQGWAVRGRPCSRPRPAYACAWVTLPPSSAPRPPSSVCEQKVPDSATYAALQTAWQEGSAAGGSQPTTMAAGGRGWGRRWLTQAVAEAETKLPASAVGTWTNCTAVCTYEV